MPLTSKQAEAIKTIRDHRYTLLVGGARSGKTYTALRRLIYWCQNFPQSRWLIMRRYGIDAKHSIWLQSLPEVLKRLDMHIDSDYFSNATDMRLMFPGRSEIRVAGLDDAERVEKLLGTEYSGLYFNESSDIPYTSVLKIKSRMSQNVGAPHKIIYDLNPTTTAHWTYKMFYQGLDPETREPIANPQEYGFCEMSPYDNRQNLPEGYIESELETYHGVMRDRFLYGKYAATSELRVFEPKSFFDEAAFLRWGHNTGWDKIKFIGGLDLGFEDADGIAILAYTDHLPDVWLVYEHKMRRQGIGDLAEAIHAGMRYIDRFPTPSKDFYIFADPAWKRDLHDLKSMFNIPVRPAYKRDRKIAIDFLQGEVNEGLLHVYENGAFHEESEQIVWTRDDSGVIVREIDDAAYHPDIMDAVLYAYRYLWIYVGKKRRA
jgi:phage terminase large subunit